MQRLIDLKRFYEALARLESKNGLHRLGDCHGRMDWPKRGVYFFMENGERREETGDGLRIVRVGTHALTEKSKSTLWKRLAQHKGREKSGSGNHRASAFRHLVGTALDPDRKYSSWLQKDPVNRSDRLLEEPLELAVSGILRDMYVLWLEIDDAPHRNSLRGTIERNSIALLSNSKNPEIDPPSLTWLGHKCSDKRIGTSGLWNRNHTNEEYDRGFLDTLERQISALKQIA